MYSGGGLAFVKLQSTRKCKIVFISEKQPKIFAATYSKGGLQGNVRAGGKGIVAEEKKIRKEIQVCDSSMPLCPT